MLSLGDGVSRLVWARRDGGGIRAVAKNNTGETTQRRYKTRVAFGREGGPVRQSGGQPGEERMEKTRPA